MKHTKGPWGSAPDKETGQYRLTAPGKDGVYRLFAQIKTIPDGTGGDLADARLIAAAPELLEACKKALKELDRYPEPDVTDDLMAAIAKAEPTDQETANEAALIGGKIKLKTW